MMRWLRFFMLTMTVMTGWSVQAFAEENAAVPAAEETETPAGAEQQTASEPDSPPENLQENNLRARSISDAFKNFKPSEEISADNAVTFPVDI